MPAGHGVVVPFAQLNPAGQVAEHDVEPAAEYCPVGHATQGDEGGVDEKVLIAGSFHTNGEEGQAA